MKFYINGMLFSPEDAKISVLDRFFPFGHGLQTPVLCLNSEFFELTSRLECLKRTADFWHFDFVWSDGDVREALCSTYESLKIPDKMVQFDLILTPGRPAASSGEEKKKTSAAVDPSIVVIPRKKHDPFDALAPAIKLHSCSPAAFSGDGLERERFLLGRVGQFYVDQVARKEGADRAFILDGNGSLAYCSGGEIALIREKNLILRQAEETEHLLPLFGELVADMGLKVGSQELTRADLEAGEEGFVLSTDWHVLPIEAIDGKAYEKAAPGPQTKELGRRLSEKVVEGMRAAF